MSATTTELIKLAQTLPPRLLRFFTRYPPGTALTPSANPFKPTVHPVTHKWHDPTFSLRRQAELVKLARRYGVEELLPETVKSTAYREARAAEGKHLKRMLKPKGKEWERTLKGRLEKRKQAMEGMPALIEKWKRAGHGRGWKDWPR
ncbi:hypothetical protein RUND412_003853 [Rhizina undulata]